MNSYSIRSSIASMSRGFVLAFHDIKAEELERFMDALEPIRPVHLSELVNRSKAGKPTTGLCAITVDDGVDATVRAVRAVCRKREWPVTFFLPTGNLDTGEGIAYQWWRQVLPLLPSRRLELSSGTFDFSRPGLIRELTSNLERRWHSAPLDDYRPFTMELVEAVARDAGIPLQQLLPPRPVSWADVTEFSKDVLIQFESHGVTHVALSALTDDQLAWEMKRSRDAIREHTGRPCRHLAYPFGSELSIGKMAPLMARRFYDSAVTMALGHVEGANPWLLPRIPLYPENSSLRAWVKIALKCSSLVGPRGQSKVVDEREPAQAASPAGQPVGTSRVRG